MDPKRFEHATLPELISLLCLHPKTMDEVAAELERTGPREPGVQPLPRATKLERFGPGPWIDEPDQVEWVVYDYPCLMLRNALGCWVGYVGVPAGHPWFEVARDDIDADVHGGLTWAGFWEPDRWFDIPATVLAFPGRWWAGFDCGHGGQDVIPEFIAVGSYTGVLMQSGRLGVYRTVQYALMQTQRLALQANLAMRQLAEGADAKSHR